MINYKPLPYPKLDSFPYRTKILEMNWVEYKKFKNMDLNELKIYLRNDFRKDI
jgi:hypothetical protein